MSNKIRSLNSALVFGLGASLAGSVTLAAQTTTVKPKPVFQLARPAPLAAKPATLPVKTAVLPVRPAPVVPKPAVTAPNAAPSPIQPTMINRATVQPVAARAASVGAVSAIPQAAPQYQQAVQQYQQAAPAQQYASQPSTIAAGGQIPGANTMAGVLAGIGTFKYGDVTALAVSCMRSGTRVFCDYDETRQNPGNVPAGWAFSGVQLVLAGGRIAGVSNSFYVDSDGSTFQTASINPTSPVRLMLEYDGIPAQNTSVTLQFGATQYPNVPLSDVGALPASGAMPARGAQPAAANTASAQSPGVGQPATGAVQTATTAAGTADNAQDKVASTADGAAQKVQKAKKTWGSIMNSVNSMSH